jgi:hypothetical protein
VGFIGTVAAVLAAKFLQRFYKRDETATVTPEVSE